MENANKAYRGALAQNYEKDRIVELIWEKEQNFIAQHINKLDRGGSILDVPVGTGRFINLYLNHGMSVFGIDISEDMLVEVRKKFGNTQNIKLERGDATYLSHGDSSVDYIICWRLVHLLPKVALAKMIFEFARVARKEIIIQTYEQRRIESRRSLVFKIHSTLSAIIKMLIARRKNECKTPWAHIQNFVHSDSEMLHLFSRCGLFVKETFVIEDAANRERIYVVKKSP